ncbi:penicillin-binding transpeptidase domain-containing protein [Streptomyces sp. NPDC006798]|uniref:penicillin-binding transpeptidase domain-containing protein n=1 Tax=Streptomyces sp. NPDC006798 TaxID=3155462 RepID=UPI0033E1C1FC
MPTPPLRALRRAAAVPVLVTLVAMSSMSLTGCTSDDVSPVPPDVSPGPSRMEPKPAGGPGDILVAGRAVTGSEPSGIPKFPFRRTYTDGEVYASVTGYRSLAFGDAGLERIVRSRLDAGKDVPTTIDPALQRAAFDGLRGRTGAAIAVDVRSGEIMALVSTPAYDPGSFAGNTRADADAWGRLNSAEPRPTLNRALRRAENPGSAAHLVVAATALEKGLVPSVDTATRTPLVHTVPGGTNRFTGPSPRCENASLRTALKHSCTNVFAAIAADLGAGPLKSTAAAFGFGDETLDTPLRAAESVWPDAPETPARLALTANGLSDVTATPVQLALVLATVLNDGLRPGPRLLASSDDPAPAPSVRVISARTADQLADALGAATTARVPSSSVNWALTTGRTPAGRTLAVAVTLSSAADTTADATAIARRITAGQPAPAPAASRR